MLSASASKTSEWKTSDWKTSEPRLSRSSAHPHRARPQGFHADALFCATHIFCDLCRNGVPRSVRDLRRMCEEHGAPVLPDVLMPARFGGCYDGDALFVSAHLSRRQYYETIPHELVHALSHSCRWMWLNGHIEGWRYDRATFLEAVARIVGKMFAAQYPSDVRSPDLRTINISDASEDGMEGC